VSEQPYAVFIWHVRYGPEPTEQIAVRATHFTVDQRGRLWLIDQNDPEHRSVFCAAEGKYLYVERGGRVTA
jgi:hypothetical protein